MRIIPCYDKQRLSVVSLDFASILATIMGSDIVRVPTPEIASLYKHVLAV